MNDVTIEGTTIEDEVTAVENLFAPVAPEQAVAVAQSSVGQSIAPVALPVERVLTAVIDAASNPAVDVGKMRELLGLQKELMAMQAEQQFTDAFDRLARVLPRIKKNGQVEYKDKKTERIEKAFRFATYEDIDAAIRPLLLAEGFTLSFDTVPRVGDGGGIIVTGILSHIGGHQRRASIPLALDSSGGKNNIQGMGSTFSYGKRYTATALLNIVTEGDDDDGKRGGTPYINPDEAIAMRTLAEEAEREEGRFLETYTTEAQSFEEVVRDDYLRLMRLLSSAKRQVDQRKAREATQ